MGLKEKLIGVILILLGALPFLLKIKSISKFFEGNIILSFIIPGEIVYQLLIIIFGILLIWTIKPKLQMVNNRF